jgi:hypothetical protein
MREYGRLKMKKKWKLSIGVLIVMSGSYLGVQLWMPVDSPPSLPPMPAARVSDVAHPIRETTAGTLPPSAGAKVYSDPKTGQFQKPPTSVTPSEAPGGASVLEYALEPQRSAQELQEKPSPVVGGGVVTNVRLRFRRPLMATRDAGGNLTIQHAPQAADLDGEQ